jgi:tellurite resistance protein TerC
VGFNLGVLALLGVDLFMLRKGAHARGFKAALVWSMAWILLAAAFGWAISLGVVGGYPAESRGPAALQFFTAYLLEKSLSLDNVLVFVLLFRQYRVSAADQRGVLFGGVLGAMVLRGVLILCGVELARRFDWVFYIFGADLLWAAWKLVSPRQSVNRRNAPALWPWLRRWLPSTEENPGGRVLVHRNGRWLITPLFAVLLTVELVDVTFALDSVPAVVAVTRDPFLAYTSNIFAVLGLRALYFVVENVIERCWLLPYALAGLLAFIGAKMLLVKVYEVPVGVSLIVIAVALGGAVLGSWLCQPPAKR